MELIPRMADFKREVLAGVIPSVAQLSRSASLGPDPTDGCQPDASLQRSFRRWHSLGGPSVCFTGLPAGVLFLHCATVSLLPGLPYSLVYFPSFTVDLYRMFQIKCV